MPMSLSYFRPRSYLFMFYILKPHIYLLWAGYVQIFLLCSLTRNVASVKGYDDHSNVSRFNFSPAVFMREKNPTKSKTNPDIICFFLNIQTGPNTDILFINLIVTKTVHYKQYRNKLKGMCHTSWLIFYMHFKNTAYSLIVHSYCVEYITS